MSAELLTPAGGASGPAVPLISSSLLLLCLGHFSVDFYSGALATLQPLLVERYSLNLSQVGTLSGVFMLGSAVCQLFFGMISDRLPSRLFVVFGLLTAGIFLSSLGLARGYGELLMLALVGGMGVAAFHPQSTSQVTVNAGVRRGLVMSIFITSGMVGLSLGPTFFSFLAQRLGLDRLSLAALPAIVVAGFLFWSLPASLNSGHQDKPPFDWEPFRRQWKPLLLQYVLVVLRSIPGYAKAFAQAFPEQSDPITYDNLARAIGAFERRLMTPSRFDDLLAGKSAALDAEELRGLQAFLTVGCVTCHMGPAFGGASYQKLGLILPYVTDDVGRFEVTGLEADRHVFKVPSLRNVTRTAPYLHDGSIETLPEVIRIMVRHQLGRELDDEQVRFIEAFLGSLTGRIDAAYTAPPALPPSGPQTPPPDPS